MLLHLIRKEILQQILSRRFQFLAVVTAVCVLLCIADGAVYYTGRQADYRKAQNLTQERLDHIGGIDIGDYIADGFHLHKPPTPLSIFSRGIDPVLGREKRTGWTDMDRWLRRSPLGVDPPIGAFLPLDLGVFIQIVLSLFAILLTYDAVCGEKQDGTLRLSASYAAPRRTLLLAKAVGASMVSLASLWLPALLGTAVVLALPGIQLSSHGLARAALMGASASVFLVTFVCAGLLGSALTQRPPTAFVILVAYWVATTLVLPRLSLLASDTLRPSFSLRELLARQESIQRKYIRERRAAWEQWKQQYVAEHGERHTDSPEGREIGMNASYELGAKYQGLGAAETRELTRDFENRYAARVALAERLADASPAFALRTSLAELSGTGLTRYNRYFGEMADYIGGVLKTWVNAESRKRSESRANPDVYGRYELNPETMPVFTYIERWPQEEVAVALRSTGIAALWGVLFFAAAFVAVVRYDVR